MNSENVNLFSKLDIRVGKIIKAEIFEQAIKPAYILTIDFGEDIGLKKTSAQIRNYELKSLINKKCIAVINLGEKQIGSIMSQCLILPPSDFFTNNLSQRKGALAITSFSEA